MTTAAELVLALTKAEFQRCSLFPVVILFQLGGLTKENQRDLNGEPEFLPQQEFLGFLALFHISTNNYRLREMLRFTAGR